MKSALPFFFFFFLLLVSTFSYGSDPITGTLTVCAGSTTTLSNATSGGTWSSGATVIGTIDATSGVFTGLTSGTAEVTYTFPTTGFVTDIVTVNPLPGTGTISGAPTVCDGSNTTLTFPITGGVWSSSDISIATVGTSGVVTGVDAGTVIISYTTTNGCGSATATTTMTVNALPDTITGTFSMCNTFTTTLADVATGGTWSSTSSRVTVGSATGVITGVSVGTAMVSYTLGTGCRTTRIVTVNQQPPTIAGTMNVCVGATRTLTNGVSGGTWSSSNTGVANIGVATVGIVSGVSADTARITYTLANGCFTRSLFTVNPVPAAITGTFVLCAGSITTLADASTGGTWSSSNTAKAVINVGSGIVQAYNAGTTTITYKTTGNCIATAIFTVLASPATITGAMTLCNGGNTQLYNAVPLGVWASADTSVAILVTPTGLVGGVGAGTVAISYTLADGCYRSAIVTVNPIPDSIVGPDRVCTARTVSLTSASPGGTWSSSNTAKATVGTSGIVTGVTTGSVVITYKLPTTCKVVKNMTVSPAPAVVTGTLSVCEGLTTSLSNVTPGGTWVSSSTSIATAASVAGIVTGVAAGTTNMSYVIIATGCSSWATLTVNPTPAVIAGASSVCAGGATTTLTSAATGGTWSSGASGIATAGSATGIITGIAAGTAMITYRLPTGCITTHIMTVTALPSAGVITGATSVCETGTTTLLASVSGGTWGSALGYVSVSSGGVVSGLAGGIDTVLYSVTDGCGVATVQYPITINPLPDTATITGNANVCIGMTSSLGSSMGGGTWSNGSTTTATVSSTGVVTGVVLGTATISYTRTNACGSSVATIVATVHALVNPGIITGKDTTCMNDTTHLVDTVSGGVWASTASWIASVNGTGGIMGVFPGTATIMYIASNVCSTDTAYHEMVVKLPGECVNSIHSPVAANITSLKMYPNPTNGMLTIETPIGGSLTIYTIDGREVKQFAIKTQVETLVLPRNIDAGVYMCRFNGKDGSVVMTRLVYEP